MFQDFSLRVATHAMIEALTPDRYPLLIFQTQDGAKFSFTIRRAILPYNVIILEQCNRLASRSRSSGFRLKNEERELAFCLRQGFTFVNQSAPSNDHSVFGNRDVQHLDLFGIQYSYPNETFNGVGTSEFLNYPPRPGAIFFVIARPLSMT